jgi:hypothetical protein
VPFAIPSPIKDQVRVTAAPTHRLFDYLVTAEAGMAGYLDAHFQRAGLPASDSLIVHVCFVMNKPRSCARRPPYSALSRLGRGRLPSPWQPSLGPNLHLRPEQSHLAVFND